MSSGNSKDNGLKHLNTVPYTPEQNGIAERRIGHSWK